MWILKMFFRIYEAIGGPVPTSAGEFLNLVIQVFTQVVPGATP